MTCLKACWSIGKSEPGLEANPLASQWNASAPANLQTQRPHSLIPSLSLAPPFFVGVLCHLVCQQFPIQIFHLFILRKQWVISMEYKIMLISNQKVSIFAKLERKVIFLVLPLCLLKRKKVTTRGAYMGTMQTSWACTFHVVFLAFSLCCHFTHLTTSFIYLFSYKS